VQEKVWAKVEVKLKECEKEALNGKWKQVFGMELRVQEVKLV
jgi:hypothetical protein